MPALFWVFLVFPPLYELIYFSLIQDLCYYLRPLDLNTEAWLACAISCDSSIPDSDEVEFQSNFNLR